MNSKKGIYIILTAIVVVIIIIMISAYNKSNEQKTKEIRERIQSEEQLEEQENRKKSLHVGAKASSDQYENYDLVDQEVVLTGDEFFNNYRNTPFSDAKNASVKCDINRDFDQGDIVVVSFECYAAEKAAKLLIDYGEEISFYCTTAPSRYNIPIYGCSSILELKIELLSEFQDVYINSICVSLIKEEAFSRNSLVLGQYVLDSYKETRIKAESQIADNSNAVVTDENYLYSIYHGKLMIYNKDSSGKWSEISSLDGLGSTRDIEFSADKSAVIITSRRNGAYIVDISDPLHPSHLAHYDSLEYSSGLQVVGNYAFICSRFFGVEIVDISDLSKPRFVSLARGNAEYQDCYFDNGYLYIGVYNHKRIDIWDVNDVMNPEMISQIKLDGSGQGCFVSDGILYAATGIDSRNDSSSLYGFGSGTGNGLEIYDVSNPHEPEWLSTSKTNGRLDINTSDVWDVTVVDNRAFLSSMYNGVYVYDVLDPKNPVLLETISSVADNNSQFFKSFDLSKYLFPYDADKETHGSVAHAIPYEKGILMTTVNMGVFYYETGLASDGVDVSYDFKTESKPDKTIQLNLYKSQLLSNNEQVWAIDVLGDYYAVANGSNGILILDKEFNSICSYNTDSPVRDIKVFDDRLYTAECEDGLGIYSFSDKEITPLGRYKDLRYDSSFGDIELTPDGFYCLCEVAQKRYTIVDIRDVTNPQEVSAKSLAGSDDVGLMYFDSCMTGVLNDKYVAIGGSKYVDYYYSENGELKLLRREDNDLYSRGDGMTAVRDGVLQISDNKYYIKNVEAGEDFVPVETSDIKFKGKCIADGDTLVISNVYNGDVMIVDISDLYNPIVLESFNVDGNTDIACIDGDTILIPCRRYGILILSR